MEYRLLKKLSQKIEKGNKAALAITINKKGSTPSKEGSMMVILEDGSILGTIGGGKFEAEVIKEATKLIEKGESKILNFKLNDEGDLNMKCGGEADVFVRVFNGFEKLLIVGGGHIGKKLYDLGKFLGYYVAIFDDREEYCNYNRFPEADELQLGDIKQKLRDYPVDSNCYIVIATRGHKNDQAALREVIDRNAAYIGMIGSIHKSSYIINNLIEEGYEKSLFENIYTPIGLDLGGDRPEDIAFNIMAEIQLVKNKGKLRHLKRFK